MVEFTARVGFISTVGYIVDVVRLLVGIIRGRFGGMVVSSSGFAKIHYESLSYEPRKIARLIL